MTHKPSSESTPLQVRFNVPPDANSPFIVHQDKSATLQLGWLTLRYGRDADGCALVQAVTSVGTFQLAPATSEEEIQDFGESARETQWIYMIEEVPEHFIEEAIQLEEVNAHGFFITYGKDCDGREFLCLVSGCEGLILLIRNPASDCTSPWPHRPLAVALREGLHITEESCASDIDYRLDEQFDKELAELMEELERDVAEFDRQGATTPSAAPVGEATH